ncbi:MAG: hypothetical protein LBR66_01625 [Candidatus Symbiothrix sp.]|jgi:hypothetical protein|nr:hypothetical protein [Candidatus Symbiothrix sp.]
MKNFILLFSLCCCSAASDAQDWVWKAGVHSFFDNTEFSGSALQTAQTMAGVHLAPEIGLQYADKHRVYAGFDVLHEFGSSQIIDFSDLIAYYEYDGKLLRFLMGAFPRRGSIDRYPRMFFQDSINNYRPVVNGFLLEYSQKKHFINAWLDWTGRKSFTQHESFFMAWSGRFQPSWLYAQHFGYMFHYAGIDDPSVHDAVHDNGLILTQLGVDLSAMIGLDLLDVNVGWAVALERDRLAHQWHTPQGLLSEIRIEKCGVGLFNSCYLGGGQQVFYGEYGSRLYWGDPLYHSEKYNRSDLYYRFIKTDLAQVKLVYSLHLTEHKLYHEQALYATFDLDKLFDK